MKKFLLIAGLLLSQAALSANPQLEIKTNQGTITVELYADKAPKSTANFLKYAKDGYYNGTIFHRVISNFMIQGGGMLPDMTEKKPSYPPIQNEAPESSALGLKNVSGTLAMARTGDPHSATAQFFINVKDNGFLDYPGQDGWGYAVFGKVTKGIEVVMKIRNVQTGDAGYHQNVPVKPVIIESVTIVPEKAAPEKATSEKVSPEKTSSPEKK